MRNNYKNSGYLFAVNILVRRKKLVDGEFFQFDILGNIVNLIAKIRFFLTLCWMFLHYSFFLIVYPFKKCVSVANFKHKI